MMSQEKLCNLVSWRLTIGSFHKGFEKCLPEELCRRKIDWTKSGNSCAVCWKRKVSPPRVLRWRVLPLKGNRSLLLHKLRGRCPSCFHSPINRSSFGFWIGSSPVVTSTTCP